MMSSTNALRLAVASVALATITATSRPALALKKGLCPGVTCTGGKPTLSLTGNGLPEADVVPIFWGFTWTNSMAGTHYGVMRSAANGAYFSALQQYGTNRVRISPMPAWGPPTDNNPIPHCNDGTQCSGACADKSTCGVSDVIRIINKLIGYGTVPPPITPGGLGIGPNMMYLALINANYFSGLGFSGLNGVGACDSTCGSQYAGFTYSFGMAMRDNYPAITHEMAEAIAGNVGLLGCTGGGGTQVSDICQCWNSAQQGGDYNAYWSAKDSACVVPEGFSGISRFNGSSWSAVGTATARQFAAGNDTEIMTDTNDDVLQYTGSGTWTQIGNGGGSGGPMYAVDSTDHIYKINSEGSLVYRFKSGTTWTSLGMPPTQYLTGIYAGKFLVVTDNSGTIWRYIGSQNWQSIGGPASQVVVNGAGIWMTIPNHIQTYFNSTGDPNAWTLQGSFNTQLFAGAGAAVAATYTVDGSIAYYGGSGNAWTYQSPASTEWALTTDGNLFQLDISGNVWQSQDTSANGPNWTKLATKKGGVRGHGNKLYAMGAIAY